MMKCLIAAAAGAMLLAGCATQVPCDTGCCASKCGPCAPCPSCKGMAACKGHGDACGGNGSCH